MPAPLTRSAPVAFLALLVALLSSAPAAAKTRILPVTVTLSDNARAQTAQVQYIIESAARRSPRHEYVDPVEKFDPAGLEQRQREQQKAIDAMAFGKRAYVNLEEGLGLESFDRAILAYEQSALWDNFKGLSQATVMRLLVKWADDQAGTKKEIARLIAIDPKAEFPADLTPPDLAAEVQKAKDARNADTKFALDVNTDPVAARVYVDGAYRGTSPTSVRGLARGEHYLTLVAPGYVVVQQKVTAGPGATATVTLKPAERGKPFLTFLDRITKGFGETDEVTAARVLARASEADEVLVAGVSRVTGRLTVTMHRISARDGHVLAVDELELSDRDENFAAQIDSLAARVLAKDRPRGPHGEPLAIKSGFEKALDQMTNISENTAKIAVGVGGATLFASGVIVGLVARSKASDLRQTVQTDPGLDGKIASTKATALAADILMASGLVAGGVWGWLQFGKAFQKRSDLDAPPLEQKKDAPPPDDDAPKKKKAPEEDDPFATMNEAASPALSFYAAPTLSGAQLGLRGSF